jgi:DNA-binding LytR/AlgR family response regulator
MIGYCYFNSMILAEKEKSLAELSALKAQLKTIVSMLPGNRFVRIHKSFVVALPHIKVFTKDYATVGTRQIPVGRAYSGNFAGAVRNWG